MLKNDYVNFAHCKLHTDYQGMLNKAGAIIVTLIFDIIKQFDCNNKNILEIGVYKGKFIALCEYITRTESYDIYGIDPFILEEQSIETVYNMLNVNDTKMNQIHLIKSFSNNINEINKFIDSTKKFILIHIDGGHSQKNVFEDILYADKIIDDNGILVLDDFFNKSALGVYSGFSEVIFTTNVDFKPFLVGNTKLYLCREKNFSMYKNLVINNIFENTHLNMFEVFVDNYKNKPYFYTRTELFNTEIIVI